MNPYSALTAATPEQSAEYFRLASKTLVSHNFTLNAVNFCLFFAYAMGSDRHLNQRLEQILESDSPLPEDLANSLLEEYICQGNHVKLESLGQDFLQIVVDMMSSLVRLAEKTSNSSHRMEECADQLSSIDQLDAALPIIETVITETRQLSEQTQNLHTDLTTAQSEITSLKEQISQARQEASVDVLTGLLNRRGLNQILESFFANSEDNKPPLLCLLMADIDHFKAINDRYGHLTGDRVLSRIAKMLVQQIKGSDSAIRYGGEEFIILLPDTQLNNARTVAENIRCSISKLVLKRPKTKEIMSKITISLGVACYQQGESIESLVDRADKALYQAKHCGRNQIALAD